MLRFTLLVVLICIPIVIQAQDCQFYDDNYLCYTGQVGCNNNKNLSSAGQASVVGQYRCGVSAIAYFGVCDSGNSPQDDQFIIDINGQIVSESDVSSGVEVVRIYPITLQPGNYPIRLSVLRDTDPPGTFRVVASTSQDTVRSRLADVCGADFSETTFEEEGTGRLITEPLPIIAYASYREDTNGDGAYTTQDNANLYLYDAYRDIEKQLTDISALDSDPSWSPDGSKIIFSSARRGLGTQSAIFVVDVTGGEPVQITDGTVTHWHPEYSPDGTQIATACYQTSICLMDADGSNLRVILERSGEYYWNPQWSPDGSKILVIGRRRDTNGSGVVDGCDRSDLFIMNRDGSDLNRVVRKGDYIFGGDWSVDGSEVIYYSAWETGNGYNCAYNDEASLGIVDLATEQDTVFIPRGRFLRTPAFSYDTTFATFTAPNADSNQDGYLDARDIESLVVFVFADGTQRRLTFDEYEIFDPAWAPPQVTELPANVTVYQTPKPVCTVGATGAVNLRTGPGTEFDQGGVMPQGQIGVDGQAMGADGFVWWRLSIGYWVRSDLVVTVGDCSAAPEIDG